jgi:hypothetical protein
MSEKNLSWDLNDIIASLHEAGTIEAFSIACHESCISDILMSILLGEANPT